MLNDALKSVRKFHNVSVQDAAREMGVSASYISEIEHGKKRIHQDILEAYSRLFNLPISAFFLIDEKPNEILRSRNKVIAKQIRQIIKWIADD